MAAEVEDGAVTGAPEEQPARPRIVRRGLSFTGVVLAFVFCCLSLTPSLLPRAWFLQGAISGVTAIIGYGLGSLLGALGRSRGGPFRNRSGHVERRWWLVMIGVGLVAVVIFGFLGVGWQQDMRQVMGMDPASDWSGFPILLLALVVFAFVLLVCRWVRLGTRTVIRFLLRFVPKPVAIVVGIVIAVIAVIGFLQGFLFDRVVDAANSSFGLVNEGTTEGTEQPTSTYLAGSPDSLIPWDTLGVKGRDFVGLAPTRQEISDYLGKPATVPIRVYVGLDSADSAETRADLAIRELERTGGFDRPLLVVFTTTGSGWVDSKAVDTLEYMNAGNTAIVASQYSFLPSWLSFLVDKSKATEAGQTMIGAVEAKLSTIEPARRPRLLVFGESLGSFGTETAFQTLDAMEQGTSGALLEGPVNVNPVWNEVTEGREQGSPVWKPVYDAGKNVRFGQFTGDLDSPAGSFDEPRTVYLQNATDPIVWWTFRLILNEPEWLNGERGPDVSPDMRWYPFITFWQVAADMAFSTGVPRSHGHVYGSNAADGWAAIAPPAGWTADDTAKLKDYIDRIDP